MVTERVTDGRRIAQLLASELRGREGGGLSRAEVVDVQEVDDPPDGAIAYGVADAAGSRRLADVRVRDDHARVLVRSADPAVVDAAEDAAGAAGLRARHDGDDGRTTLFVENGVGAKRAADTIGALLGGDET